MTEQSGNTLRLRFRSTVGQDVETRPFPSLWLTAASVSATPDSPPIAVFDGTWWQLDGHYYSGFDCEGRCRVSFHTPDLRRDNGPFQRLWTASRVLYADLNMLAVCDQPAGGWRSPGSGDLWPMICIEAVR